MNFIASSNRRPRLGRPQVLLCVAALFAFGGPARSQELPAGTEKETVETVCTVCHTLERIIASARSREEWQDLVRQMISNGAALPEDKIDPVVEYLAQNFPPPPGMTGPAPRTPDGKPDLSGTWVGRRVGHAEMELTPWGKDKLLWNSEPAVMAGQHMPAERQRVELDPIYHCYPPGMVRLGPPLNVVDFGINSFQFLQTPGMLIVVAERRNGVRYIYMDGREHPKILEATWNGHSIGKWDGDTLVVDTIGLRDEAWLDSDGHEHSTQLRVVERFRRPTAGILEIERTLTDPIALAKPHTSRTVLRLNPRRDLNENSANNDCSQYMVRKPAFGEGMGGLLGIADQP